MAAQDASPTSSPLPVFGPARNAALVTPSDSADLDFITTGIYVGGAGNIKVTMQGGQSVLLSGVLAGSVLPLRVSRIWSTTTTATTIVALW